MEVELDLTSEGRCRVNTKPHGQRRPGGRRRQPGPVGAGAERRLPGAPQTPSGFCRSVLWVSSDLGGCAAFLPPPGSSVVIHVFVQRPFNSRLCSPATLQQFLQLSEAPLLTVTLGLGVRVVASDCGVGGPRLHGRRLFLRLQLMAPRAMLEGFPVGPSPEWGAASEPQPCLDCSHTFGELLPLVSPPRLLPLKLALRKSPTLPPSY